jgi:predicted thioesterase
MPGRRKDMLQAGIKAKEYETVTVANTAQALGSGLLPVFATPAMILLMESTASKSVEPYLEPGQGTVGTALQIKHVSATPVGMQVRCEIELTEIDGKRLVFSVKAYDRAGLIGEGIHERFIIDNERFLQRANAKKAPEEQ